MDIVVYHQHHLIIIVMITVANYIFFLLSCYFFQNTDMWCFLIFFTGVLHFLIVKYLMNHSILSDLYVLRNCLPREQELFFNYYDVSFSKNILVKHHSCANDWLYYVYLSFGLVFNVKELIFDSWKVKIMTNGNVCDGQHLCFSWFYTVAYFIRFQCLVLS